MKQKIRNLMLRVALTLAMVVFALPSLSLGSITLKDGLVAYYPFNGNANDESGNGNNGTVNGATLTKDNDGNASSAYSFDGVNDYISVPYNASKPIFNLENRFTYSLWFYANASGELTVNQPLIGRQQCQKAFPSAELDLLKSEIAFTLNYQQAGTHKQFIPSQTVIPNQWTHIAGTYDKEAGLVNIYVNGENILSESYSQSIWKPATSFWIGGIPKPDNYSSCWETFFNGNIDNIRIYNRALSESEIEELYNSEGGNLSGNDPPNGISTVDANANPNNAPVYMGNIVSSGGVSTLSGNMELSVNFPAYNKPVNIWILIALPDGRFYTANESGKLLSFASGDLAAIAYEVSGTKTEKEILTPFEIASSGTPFDPFPYGNWTAYWLVSPDSNGDIFQAIENGDYELGFYIFQVNSNNNPDIGTELDIEATLHDEFLAVRDTSIISETDENSLAQAVIKANEADLQTKMLFNSFYMASDNTSVKTLLNTYRAMTESFRITTEKYDDIILIHQTIETTARKRGGHKLFSIYGQELNTSPKLQWYLDNYGKSTPAGNKIDIKAIAERNKISTEKAFSLLKTQYGVIAELANASAIKYEAAQKTAEEIKVASDRANTVLSFATGGQALLGAFKAAKTLNTTLKMYEASTLGYNTAGYLVKTQTKNLVQGAVNGGFQIGDGVFGILTDPSVENNFSSDFRDNLNMAKSLWSGINIVKGLTFDPFCLLSVKDAFTGNSKLIISDLTDFTKTTVDTIGHIISIMQDETGGFFLLFQQPESFSAEALKKELVYKRLSPDNMLTNGDYTATDENGKESSFQVTDSNALDMLQHLSEEDILIDANGNVKNIELWDDEDGQGVNLTDQQKTDFLNCACRCSSGWAGHIGVWYDPNPANKTENGGTGPCIGGVGSFGGTSRHQLIITDCTKGCWPSNAGTYNSSAVEEFLKQENDNFTNIAK